MAASTASAPEQTAEVRTAGQPSGPDPDDVLVAEELLVEEISIDGMCGVY